MASLLDRCMFVPTAGGTTDFTVSAAVTGYMTPAQAGAVNATTYYYGAESSNKSEWELGLGTYTVSGTVLARTTVLYSSNANAKVNFTNPPNVFITLLAENKASNTEFGLVRGDGSTVSVSSGVASVLSPSAMVLISEITTSASQSNVTFSGISSSYRDLRLMIRGKGDKASGDVQVYLQFNGDTGNNYAYTNAYFNTGFNGNAASTSGTEARLGFINAANSSPSTAPGAAEILLTDYRNTNFQKTAIFRSIEFFAVSPTSQNSWFAGGLWKSTSAITSVKVFLESGNFADNSVVSLYGMM